VKKYFFLLIILSNCMSLWAHSGMQVQSVKDAVSKYSTSAVKFKDVQLGQKVKYLKKMKYAESEGLRFYLFKVQGDFGPVVGMYTFNVKKKSIVGLEILSFTMHAQKVIIQPKYLDKFREMTKLKLKEFPILESEPKTTAALKEVAIYVFLNNN